MGNNNHEPMDRILILGNYVDQDATTNLIQRIYEINRDDDKKEKELKDFTREPITLIVKTYGGYFHDCMGLCGAIELSKTPVHGICLGHAMSAGLPVFLCCHKRTAYKNSTFLYHEISCWLHDKLQGLKEEVKEIDRMQAIYDEYITSKTSILQEKLDQVRERKQDWCISAQEALKLGIITEILG